MKFTYTVTLLILLPFVVKAQESSVDKLDKKYLNWFNQDPDSDHILGASVDKAYREILKDKGPGKTVIVAVIDSGVDFEHEDLREHIWVNEDEIPGNGIDDDKNGYIDDVHGWNFLGNRNGENISIERLDVTRLVASGPGPLYDMAKTEYDKQLAKRQKEKENIEHFEDIYNTAKKVIKDATGVDVTSAKDLDQISPEGSERFLASRRFLAARYEMGFTESGLKELKQHNKDFLEGHLNLNLDPRKIAGDDPENFNDRNYGNPDVKGPNAEHGTSVAAIIAAVRDNNIGINGIATNVKIMCIRSTPNGDERDKDVALAIRYAVENGAQIINMSFGKAISPHKEWVDDAMKLAVEKGVLLIHASGNDGKDLDKTESFPVDYYLDKTDVVTMINIGATDQLNDEKAAAFFSNYGAKHVDLFAPGVNIISADTSNLYNMHDGTSLSAPVVSGVAALLLSYYPELTAKDLIQILLDSSTKLNSKVIIPGDPEKKKKVKFSSLSRSGGIVNAYEAMKKAETFKR